MSERGLKVASLSESLDIFKRDRDNQEVIRLKTRFLQGFLKFLSDFMNHIEYVNHIFNLFREEPNDEKIKKRKITD